MIPISIAKTEELTYHFLCTTLFSNTPTHVNLCISINTELNSLHAEKDTPRTIMSIFIYACNFFIKFNNTA